MQINKKPWAILSVCGLQQRIDTNPDYQRPAAWSKSQKQLLIDTIVRGYDVPKFYWLQTAKSPSETWEVVDGQQRLRAIFEYHRDGFTLPDDSEPIKGHKVAGLKYSELPTDVRMEFDNYQLDVSIIQDPAQDEVEEMFLRLQNGTTLKAQEKRNAMPGNMRDLVREIGAHQFFNSCNFKNGRLNFDLVAAQMIAIELAGEPTNIKAKNLNDMYADNKSIDPKGMTAKKVKRVLEFLLKSFPSKTGELERYSVVSLYIIVSQCLENYVMDGRESEFSKWFIALEQERLVQNKLAGEDMNPEFLSYREAISHSTDSLDSLKIRDEFLSNRYFLAQPDLVVRDTQRTFTHPQRLAIFRRDQQICQVRVKCSGAKCDWDAWEADHILPHSKGGKTTVENGQVACPPCNASKGATLN